jgi:long-chain acyl-CoA synthetase
MDEATKSEGIEALVYPADSLLTRINVKREDKSEASKTAILNEVNAYIDRVNRTLQPYQRISKVTILDEPLEMTTTKKVKRNYSK